MDTEITEPGGEKLSIGPIEVDVRRGDYSIRVTAATFQKQPKPEPTIDLARRVLSRLPAAAKFPARLVPGPCAAIELEAAGKTLTGARQYVDTASNVLTCDYAGQRARLTVALNGGPSAIDDFEFHQEIGTPIDGVGDGAYRKFPDWKLMPVGIRVGDQHVVVDAKPADGKDPPDEDINRMLRSIADSIPRG
ncbi:hypothetical protein [Flindersiella endophytica]